MKAPILEGCHKGLKGLGIWQLRVPGVGFVIKARGVGSGLLGERSRVWVSGFKIPKL